MLREILRPEGLRMTFCEVSQKVSQKVSCQYENKVL